MQFEIGRYYHNLNLRFKMEQIKGLFFPCLYTHLITLFHEQVLGKARHQTLADGRIWGFLFEGIPAKNEVKAMMV